MVAISAYWISPLPWWALRALRARAEDAADDAALRTGIRSSSYAAQLVALARKRLERAGPAPAAGLRDRVGAILDVRRARSREPRWSGWVVFTAWRLGGGRLALAGAGMIVGGALGNLYDRLFRVDELGQHGVVDFIRVNFPWGGSWPNFNVADAVLVVGLLLLLWSLRGRR